MSHPVSQQEVSDPATPSRSGQETSAAPPDQGGQALPDAAAAAGSTCSRLRWIPYVAPLFVFLLVGQFEPKAGGTTAGADAAASAPANPEAATAASLLDSYPLVYFARIALTLAAMALAWPTYRLFRFRISPLALLVGAVGAALWIGLCLANIEGWLLGGRLDAWLGGPSRAAYDPLTQLGDQPALLAGFLAVRFVGLVLVVSIVEEFFLRGFLARFVIDNDWWKIPVGATTGAVVVAVILYAGISHPGELLAAGLWFSLGTWLVARTKNIWDCVAMHAVTNLLLGIYVVASGDWWLW